MARNQKPKSINNIIGRGLELIQLFCSAKVEVLIKKYKLDLISYHLSRKGINGLHIYHIIKPSKWPVLMSIVLFALAIGFVIWTHPEISPFFSKFNLYTIFFSFLSVFYFWCFDLMNESGEHNQRIRQGIKLGMILFILSEFMFFFAFFWAYLHSSTNPSIWIAHAWPPLGQATLLIESISLPFLNTLLLLTSGFCVTLTHKFSSVLFTIEESLINLKINRIFFNINSLIRRLCKSPRIIFFTLFNLNYNRHSLRVGLVISLAFTIFLALVFTNIQYHEYVEANFNISDGIFASCFYLMTGFHGIHVIVGTVFLIACFIQLKSAQRFYKEMTGLDCAIWYWHFVDVVWLFLYVIVYLIADDVFHHEMSDGLLCYLYDLEKLFNNFSYGCINNLVQTRGYALPNQLGFNPSATTAMSEIIWLHDYIMFFIIVIFFVVLALFYGILKEYTVTALYEYYLRYKQNRIDAKFYDNKKNQPFSSLSADAKGGGGIYVESAEIRNTGF